MQKIWSMAASWVEIPLIITSNSFAYGVNLDSAILEKILYVVDKIDMPL
jgi:hypothetical protein